MYYFLILLYQFTTTKEAHEIRGGAPGYIPGVSSFLFCSVIGGVERGKSTRAGKRNRDI